MTAHGSSPLATAADRLVVDDRVLKDRQVRQLAQSDPVPNLSHRWGEVVARARQRTEELTLTLRNLDAIQAELKERGLEVATDLGPIGNAAAAARRDLERTSTATFELPR